MIAILSLAQNQTITGKVSFSVKADSTGVVALQFKLDGANLGPEITSGACVTSWDSTSASDGLHTVEAVARDEYNDLLMAPPVTVLVSNPRVPIPDTVTLGSPTAGMTISGPLDVVVNFTGTVTASKVTVQVRTTTGAIATTLSTISSQGAGWVSFKADLTKLVANGQYDLVATSGAVYTSPVRVTVSGRKIAPPASMLPPRVSGRTVRSKLTIKLQIAGGRDFVLTATVKSHAVPVGAGVTVTFLVTDPKRSKTTYMATTDADGVATFTGRLPAGAARGVYRVTASASHGGLSASPSGRFIY